MSRVIQQLQSRMMFSGRKPFSQAFHSQPCNLLQGRAVARSHVFHRNVATQDVPPSSSKLGSAKPTSDQQTPGTAPERRTGQSTGGGADNGDHELPAELFGGKTRQVDNRKPLSEQTGGGDHRTSEGFFASSSHHKDQQVQSSSSTLGEKAAAAKDFVADAAGAAKDFVKSKAGAAAATVKETVKETTGAAKGYASSNTGNAQASNAGAAKGYTSSNTGNSQASNAGASSYSSSKAGGTDQEVSQKESLERRTANKTPPDEAHDANERMKRMEEAGVGKSTATGSPYTDPSKNKGRS